MSSKLLSYAPPVVCGIMLLGMTALDPMRVDWESAQPYQARARAAVAAVPLNFGVWTGQDQPIEQDALNLLRPNATLQRYYWMPGTELGAGLLIVQCSDTRDMLGHYPQICYPSQGWSIQSAVPCEWEIAGMTIHGMEYEVMRPRGHDEPQRNVVRDFFVLPNGTFARDMESVQKAAKSYKLLPYGVAQFQLIFSPRLNAHQRDVIFNDLVGANASLIEVMKSGGMR